MKVNANPTMRAVVDSTLLAWVDSPVPGVERRILARDGDEVAQATSIVRYSPGCHFPRHRHDQGEEFLVLHGEFCDEFGSYPEGTYVKNPAGTSHAPYSILGCELFVKLRQLDSNDQERVVVQTAGAKWLPGRHPGLTVLPLSEFGYHHTALVRWAPGTQFIAHRHYGGEEILVLEGIFEDENGRYPRGTWIRSPHLSEHRPFSQQGCTIFVKTGHLPVSRTARRGAC
jgi:anti-sigma factor ChrR (cupin superfamily)